MSAGTPIVVAGDLLDHWDQPPWFINWLIDHMPAVYAIPGQHDLPHHRYADIKRSAYWTLCEAGRVINLDPADGPKELGYGMFFYPFPWGLPLAPCSDPADGALRVAVIHRYCWSTERTAYSKAVVTGDRQVGGYRDALTGYAAAVFGDNHCGFSATTGSCFVFNHGTFVRRHADEKDLVTGPGLLYSDGTVDRAAWDTSADRWVDAAALSDLEAAGADADALVALLTRADEQTASFRAAVRDLAADDSLSAGCRRLLTEWATRGPE